MTKFQPKKCEILERHKTIDFPVKYNMGNTRIKTVKFIQNRPKSNKDKAHHGNLKLAGRKCRKIYS